MSAIRSSKWTTKTCATRAWNCFVFTWNFHGLTFHTKLHAFHQYQLQFVFIWIIIIIEWWNYHLQFYIDSYGLLGASGCGKTTLLSCIVGRKRLNSGEIWVLGGKPGTRGSGVPGKRVGYMPQEIALYAEFSIKETMTYFGWIFGMSTPEIIERLRFLLNFLDLPSENRLVKNLSGGQQRRVSFAVALMHDPELLILDEPTVGVDPLLRQSIWNHLVHITKAGQKTVIITTHYIEEARQAHTVSWRST